MPSLGQLLASQLGLGAMPLAAPKAAVPGLVLAETENARQVQLERERKEALFNNKPASLTTQGRRAMRLAPDKQAPLASPAPNAPSEEIVSSKPEAMTFAPIWEEGMKIVSKVRASGDLATVSKLNAQLQAVESGNPEVAIPAAMALQTWYKNSPLAIADMTKGRVEKVPAPKKKKEVPDEP